MLLPRSNQSVTNGTAPTHGQLTNDGCSHPDFFLLFFLPSLLTSLGKYQGEGITGERLLNKACQLTPKPARLLTELVPHYKGIDILWQI